MVKAKIKNFKFHDLRHCAELGIGDTLLRGIW